MPQECRPRVTELPSKRTYTLKIAIKHIKPPVWRRVRAPGSLTLADLHSVIQIVFGWENDHLHDFRVGDKRYGDPTIMDELVDLNEERYTLDGVFAARAKKMLYTYDFGDNWEHEITVEKREPASPADEIPVCLAGKRAGPPDDCGGPWGYGDLLESAKDPESERYEELMEWMDLDSMDPEEFDLPRANVRLAKVWAG